MRFNTAKRRGKSARVALSWQSAVAAIASALWHYRVARARGMVRFDIPKGPEASARCALGSQSDTHDRCHGALPGQSASTALFSREAPWHEGAFHRSPSLAVTVTHLGEPALRGAGGPRINPVKIGEVDVGKTH